MLLVSYYLIPVCAQTLIDATKRYDEIIDLNKIESTTSQPVKTIENIEKKEEASSVQETQEKVDELILLLPKLDKNLHSGWVELDKPLIAEATSNYAGVLSHPLDFLNELGLEKILKQTYAKEGHVVEVLIYKFKDFAGAYSAYTVLHGGATTKLKVGKNASESEKLVNFWKSNYFIDIHTLEDNNNIAKEFIILFSQDLSYNIKEEQLPPVVAIQLPALNRIQGSEKYCLGTICCKTFFTSNNLDCSLFNLNNSGGSIQAEYQFSESPKERVSLTLTRYLTKENAQKVFDSLKNGFEKEKKINKDIDLDIDVNDSIVKVKNKKKDYTFLKQKGNLLAIVHGLTNKKSGDKVLDLIPWPIEITKP